MNGTDSGAVLLRADVNNRYPSRSRDIGVITLWDASCPAKPLVGAGSANLLLRVKFPEELRKSGRRYF